MSLIDQFSSRAAQAGFVVHRGQLDPAVVSEGEPSRAAYGLADTGSVVVVTDDEPRARSLLPFVHVTYLPEVAVLPGLAELFEALGDDLPTSVAIITGPSRSSDIEQLPAVGVHGPGVVHVVLI